MMNHLDEYQALFKLFESMGDPQVKNGETAAVSNPLSSLFAAHSMMPDISSLQKMMEGSDLVDEFTYVEEPSGPAGDGS